MSMSLEVIAIGTGVVSHINKSKDGKVGMGNMYVCPVTIINENGGKLTLKYMCYIDNDSKLTLNDTFNIDIIDIDDNGFVNGFIKKSEATVKMNKPVKKKQTKAAAARAERAKANKKEKGRAKPQAAEKP